MRRSPLASVLLLLAVSTHAADVRPAPRPRLMLEPVATSASLPNAGESASETTPILQVDTSLLATRPAGETVQMAPYVISEPRMKLPTPGQVLTRKGRLDFALQRRPGLRFLSFWGLNNKVALAMHEEDQALERHREMNQLVALYSIK